MNTTLFVVSVVAGTCYGAGYDVNTKAFKSEYGLFAGYRLNEINRIAENYKDTDDIGKVKLVNNIFNSFSFASDQTVWNVDDYWEQPLQFIGVGLGDCEDYALSKYDLLLRMGVLESKLFLYYVRQVDTGIDHMVLAYKVQDGGDDGEYLILDNINEELMPLKSRTDLYPIFAFNSESHHLLKGSLVAVTRNAINELLGRFSAYKQKTGLLKYREMDVLKEIRVAVDSNFK